MRKIVDAHNRYKTAAQQQEPVAWVREHELPLAPGDAFSWVETFLHKTPLYKFPPARKPWVGLTDDECLTEAARHLGEMHVENCGLGDIKDFARAIEAKLKEKNT